MRLDVEDVDRFVRAVGEVIGPVGDEADIEGGELLARNLDCRDTLDRRAFAARPGVAEDKLANPKPIKPMPQTSAILRAPSKPILIDKSPLLSPRGAN